MRLIDADALIIRLSDWALGASPNESDRGETRALRQREYDTIEHCVGVIVSAPTVKEPIRLREDAEWLWDRPHHYRCSKCQYIGGISAMSYKFCPACGRKMSVSKAEYYKEWCL